MPTEIEIDYTQEVCRAFEEGTMWEQEEISYEQHIERMDRIRDTRRDMVYPATPRDPLVEPTRDFRGGRTLHDAYSEATTIAPKFKVGDKVLLDPRKVKSNDFNVYASSGRIGDMYIITEVLDRGAYITYYLNGSNYHKEEWLTLVPNKNLIGGELL